ncbi:MAG: ABC transporter permease [Fimbriimonadaceae bacterium]|nr:ABC transporter permease [Alphaproteobacteria bacterium]
MTTAYSLGRFAAVLVKEFIQMSRDRMTFAMMIGIPIMQLLLFGYAINTNPKHLPTIVQMTDSGPFSRSFLAAMKNSSYFDFLGIVDNPQETEAALQRGDALFVVIVPKDFERDVVRGMRPSILIEADATDPSATGNAMAAVDQLVATSLRQHTTGPLAGLAGKPTAFEVIVHPRYNPAGKTSFNIVPGLLAIILAMTMVMITSIAIVREIERGTMETLLSTPTRPIEVMLGKILPYVLVGYVQTGVFLTFALILFDVPFRGSGLSLWLALNLYIIANLALGFLFSTIARTQMQAMQMSFFYILPTILLSGFMFPFAGMPGWAQVIGSFIPTTHFIRVVRKIMLKGAEFPEIVTDLSALAIITLVVTALAMMRYRQTLD